MFLKSFNGSFFRDLNAPRPETCAGCPNDAYCRGYFARTLNANDIQMQEFGEMRCQWRTRTGFDAFVNDRRDL